MGPFGWARRRRIQPLRHATSPSTRCGAASTQGLRGWPVGACHGLGPLQLGGRLHRHIRCPAGTDRGTPDPRSQGRGDSRSTPLDWSFHCRHGRRARASLRSSGQRIGLRLRDPGRLVRLGSPEHVLRRPREHLERQHGAHRRSSGRTLQRQNGRSVRGNGRLATVADVAARDLTTKP